MSHSERKEWQFASESVSAGHPDKVCDSISDALVDAFFKRDSEARCAIETMVTTNKVVIAGETRCANPMTTAEIEQVARETIKRIGYAQEDFHSQMVDVEVLLHEQSSDIAQGVDEGGNKEECAGDQGIMFGYACRETEALMPAPIFYAHKILRLLDDERQGKLKGELEPDAKSQISVMYERGKPVRTSSVVLSSQHRKGLSPADVREMVRPIIEKTLPDGWMCDEKDFFVNPTGNFEDGGPAWDCGLTGRKIIVDTYGGAAPHGGGAFSGKDPTKVDRSAAYAARYLAKNIVASGVADRCTLQLSYAIGVAHPLSIYMNFHGTGKCSEAVLEEKISSVMDLTPKGIRTHLALNKPIYARTAAYGHFGREPESDGGFSWEKTDIAEKIAALV